MATEQQLSKADVEQRMARILRLVCVGGLTSLLAAGCANMKPGEGSPASTPQSATAVQPPVQAAKPKPAPAPVPAATEVKKADAAAEMTADQLVASLAKPASEVVVPVKPAPAPMPVVKVEPTPKPVVEPKPLPVPVVKVEPAPAPEVKPAPVVVSAPAPAPVSAPEPAPVVSAPVVAEAAAPTPAPEMSKGEDLLTAESDSSAPISKSLPIRFELWRIDKGRGPYDAGAVLITPTFQMGNNQTAGQIYVTVMEDKVLVTSSSTIAGKDGLSGIRIDEGGWLPFTDITEDNVAVVRGNWLDKLQAGSKLTIRMGFFPDMSKSPEQFESEVSLTDMRTAIPRYKKLLN